MTKTERDVRQSAKDYVEGRTTLKDFVLWLAATSWSLDDNEEPALVDLVRTLELRIAEFTSGDWTEAELKNLILSPLSASTVILETRPQRAEVSFQFSNRSGTRTLHLAVA